MGAQVGAERPNILFALADDMSHASCYGYRFLDTPNFDRIAREGIRFDRAYTPSSKCAPSRSVISCHLPATAVAYPCCLK